VRAKLCPICFTQKIGFDKDRARNCCCETRGIIVVQHVELLLRSTHASASALKPASSAMPLIASAALHLARLLPSRRILARMLLMRGKDTRPLRISAKDATLDT